MSIELVRGTEKLNRLDVRWVFRRTSICQIAAPQKVMKDALFPAATTASSQLKLAVHTKQEKHKAVSVVYSNKVQTKKQNRQLTIMTKRLGHLLTCTSFKAAIRHKVPPTVRDMIHLPPSGGDGVEHLLLSQRLAGDT